jgi:hypothetical protein
VTRRNHSRPDGGATNGWRWYFKKGTVRYE